MHTSPQAVQNSPEEKGVLVDYLSSAALFCRIIFVLSGRLFFNRSCACQWRIQDLKAGGADSRGADSRRALIFMRSKFLMGF